MAGFAPEGGVLLIATRALSVAFLLSLLGGLVFRMTVAPAALRRLAPVEAAALARRLKNLARGSGALGLVALAAWLVAQSVDMADATSVRQALTAVPTVLRGTPFGHLVLAQAAAVALCLVLLRRPAAALLPAAAAVALQAGHSHAASMEGDPIWLPASDLAHLLAASVWLGGLPPLVATLRAAPPALGRLTAERFSPIGKACVLILAVTAAYQGFVLAGGLPGFVGTAYGAVLLVKLALFATLIGFAWVNQYRLVPRLPARGSRALVRSVALETLVGLAVVIAAATLSALPPGMHLEPWWPFAWRFSLVTVQADASFRDEALGAVLALAASGLLVIVAALLRRWRRWAALAGAAVIAWLAIPHLDLLFVPAYPTSYYHSPTGFTAASLMQGAALYPTHCAACHGAAGNGDGPLAKTLPVPPADLDAAHLWEHSDGELYWWLAHGIVAPDGRPAMPGFAAALPPDARWALIDFIRGRNAGDAFARTGDWPRPLAAPDFSARCENGSVTLSDLRGGFVRLVDGPAQAVAGVITIRLDGQGDPGPGLCIADDEAAAPAYALVAGLPIQRLEGVSFLVDANGWLRAVQPAGAVPGWNDAQALQAAIATAQAHKLTATPGAGMPPGMRM